MRFDARQPPRRYPAGRHLPVEIADCGSLHLDADEQVTFVTERGGEYDVARKSWGFYATPSTNARLAGFGLRAALVLNEVDRAFVMLVEAGEEADFQAYLDGEHIRLLAWLDTDEAVAGLVDRLDGPGGLRCLCGSRAFELAFTYDERPEIETAFPFDGAYWRETWRCERCGHHLAVHDMDLSGMYEGAYVDANYGDALRATYDRILALPPERSDNARRVARLGAYATERWGSFTGRRLLDVGSGLGVFPHAAARAGWDVTALDPDARAAAHIRDVVGVPTVHGDFLAVDLDDLGSFDVVTFNRVLEHVADPVAMLRRARGLLVAGGFAYVEVPDAEVAAEVGKEREELTIDHLHVFSAASLAVLVDRAGLLIERLDRVTEPSGKFSLLAHVAPAPG